MSRYAALRMLVIFLLFSLLNGQATPAMAEPGPDASPPLPVAGEPAALPNEMIYSVAGSDFHPRSSSVKPNYQGGGCVSSLGASSQQDSNAFTAPLNLPHGATILGIRLLGYDNEVTSNASLKLFTFPVADFLATASSDGHSGYFSQYASLATPFVVNTISGSLSLVWYSDVADADLRLCAARVYYTPPPPPSASAQRRTQITGADLVPRDLSTLYQYYPGGEIYSTEGGDFGAYADIPDGAALVGLYLSYNDTSPNFGLAGTLLAHDAVGSTTVLASGTNGSATGGNGTVYITVDPPRIVDQSSVAPQISVTLPADMNVKVRSVQLAWTAPAAPAAVRHRFIPGVAFQRRDDTTTYAAQIDQCVSITGGDANLTHALHLPDGARIVGLSLYTYDTSTTDSVLTLFRYEGNGVSAEPLKVRSAGAGGYGTVAVAAEYTVDTYYPHSLVWHPNALGTTLRLCGVRVDYVTPVVFLPLVMR